MKVVLIEVAGNERDHVDVDIDIVLIFFISGVTFFFSEADLSINEGRDPPIITAHLSKNPDTRLANPVTFKVLPVTIKEAEETGWPIPPGAQLVNDPASPFEASKSSFSFSFVC